MDTIPENVRVENVKITKTFLGPDDRGRFSGVVSWEGEGLAGDFVFSLCSASNPEVAVNFIVAIVEAVGASSWETLRGKFARVQLESQAGGYTLAIGNIIESKWAVRAELVAAEG